MSLLIRKKKQKTKGLIRGINIFLEDYFDKKTSISTAKQLPTKILFQKTDNQHVTKPKLKSGFFDIKKQEF